MIVSKSIAYLLEVNILLGLTMESLILKSAEALGMRFTELLDRIVEYSLE